MEILKKAAEILVTCGYAKSDYSTGGKAYLRVAKCCDTNASVRTDPFADTLEGRRQADAIEDFLHLNNGPLLVRAKICAYDPVPYNGRQKRLNRIKKNTHYVDELLKSSSSTAAKEKVIEVSAEEKENEWEKL